VTGDPGARPAPEDVQATFAAVLVDEWARGGVRRAVVCPGSRSAPVALALARHPDVAVDVRLDERSAGFYALGAALESGRPVALCTTSGTAAAEVHAAVVEAHHGRVPLIVCSADRPPELHHVGAPQTIDQAGLFGPAARFAVDLGVAEWEARGSWRAIASRLVAEACAGPLGPGPVHVNVALREPLLGSVVDAPQGRGDGQPWHRLRGGVEGPGDLEWATRLAGRRGVIVAGSGAGDPDTLFALADALGWPLLADVLSGCRMRRPGVVGAADAIVRSPEAAEYLRPEAVIRVGLPWASRVLAEWVASLASSVPQVVVDPWWRWADPARVAGDVVRAEPTRWAGALVRALSATGADAGGGAVGTVPAAPTWWRRAWSAADAAAWDALGHWSGAATQVSEPALARAVVDAVPVGGVLVVSSSMPVRDVEWFVEPTTLSVRTLANRGANGIDGVVSTALGAAAGGTPVVALVGDLAFLHDLSALVRSADRHGSCTVVVADNGGGGIFSFLPQAGALAPAEFERLFATPQAVDVARAAAGLGIGVDDVGDMEELHRALAAVAARDEGIRVVRVRLPDRAQNVATHDEIHAAMSQAAAAAVRADEEGTSRP